MHYNLAFSDFNWRGDHVIQCGVKYNTVTLDDRDSSAGAEYSYFVTPSGTDTIPYRVIFGKVNSGLPLTASPKDKQFRTYIQEHADVNDKMTHKPATRSATPDAHPLPQPAGCYSSSRLTPKVNTGCNDIDGRHIILCSGDYEADRPEQGQLGG